MKKTLRLVSISMCCCMLIIGCASTNKIKIQQKLKAMSDSEIIDHYKMIEWRIADLDRKNEQSIKNEQNLLNESYPYQEYKYYQLKHLHIGDTWSELKAEKKQTLHEIRIRGLSPP